MEGLEGTEEILTPTTRMNNLLVWKMKYQSFTQGHPAIQGVYGLEPNSSS